MNLRWTFVGKTSHCSRLCDYISFTSWFIVIKHALSKRTLFCILFFLLNSLMFVLNHLNHSTFHTSPTCVYSLISLLYVMSSVCSHTISQKTEVLKLNTFWVSVGLVFNMKHAPLSIFGKQQTTLECVVLWRGYRTYLAD